MWHTKAHYDKVPPDYLFTEMTLLSATYQGCMLKVKHILMQYTNKNMQLKRPTEEQHLTASEHMN